MERTQTSGLELVALVRKRTGHVMSPTMLSFILRGSRRCSAVNAEKLSAVTGVPFETLRAWPKVSQLAKQSVRRSKRVA